MKRGYSEISSEEWESDRCSSFNPSRVLLLNNNSSSSSSNSSSSAATRKPNPNSKPKPIESFAYSSLSSSSKNIIIPDDNDDDSVEILGDSTTNHHHHHPNSHLHHDLEDHDFDLPSTTTANTLTPSNPNPNPRRRFVVDDDDDDSSGDDFDHVDVVDQHDDDDDDDVVGRALHKCSKISADLRRDLYGSSAAAPSDRYAEVDHASSSSSSAVRIVTQDDISEACEAQDSDFQPILKPYQLVGVNFLLLLYRKHIGGAILADEMGLGKTIQAITYLTLLKHLQDDPGPHLIVCPASVLENWERELKKWCPSFSVLQYHGNTRASYSKELNSLAKAGLPPPFNVILVCYSLFERHSAQQKDDRKILKRWQWSCVLMDEAHALKDKSSYRWKNLMSVARNANQRLMLTGTPLQNDLHELWSLLEFMMPDLFETGDIDLKKLLSSEDRDLISRIKSILGPFILRRLKSDVMQQLVPKIQRVEYVEMEKEQCDAYKEAIEEYRTASQSRALTSNNVSGIIPQRQISNYFVQFRKIANHPLLVRRIYSDEDIVRFAKKLHPSGVFGFECTLDRVIEELKSYNDFSIHRLLLYNGVSDSKGILSKDHVMVSAKCRTLAKLLPSLWRSGHRVLIFSQWTSMLDILEWALEEISLTYRRLDGSTPVAERQSIVDSFNNDTLIFACLLSTRAGGQGLNLTGADTVIIHDMDFNPQIDRQAEDRCHRIGQTKPVTIYRLVTKDTVDENVYEIAKRKLVLDAAVLESGEEVNAGDISVKTMGEILSSLLLR